MRLAALAAAAAALALPATASAQFFDVGKLPLPPVTGKELADNTAAFSSAYAGRVTGSAIEMQAATFLQDEATKLGYKTEIAQFPAASSEPASAIRGVIATKPGTTRPDEHIIFIAHYDVLPQSVEGAYDNGSGTNMLRGLAKAFATIPTNRTIVFAWYNGEEEGALASDRHAQQFAAAGKKVRVVIGNDMVGIGYPVAAPGPTNCLCSWRGEDDDAFDELQRHVHFKVMGLPDVETLVEVVGLNNRNSDEASWDESGYPTMRWAGMRTAGSYPAYHMPDDTMDTIDMVAGGRTFFEQGMRNTLVAQYLSALVLDNESPVAKAAATSSGASVSFSAGGSSDPDGAPSHFTWDFGDGTTGTGAGVAHTYSKGGDYTATLSVGDNLWPQVTATAAVPVKVTVPAATKTKPKAKRKKCKRGYKRATKGKKKGRCVKVKRKKKRSKRRG